MKFKKSLEELLGILLIGTIFLFLFAYYLVSTVKVDRDDFSWKEFRLEYVTQVLLNEPIFYTPSCYISFQQLLTNLAESPSKLPSCYTEFIDSKIAKTLNLQLLQEIIEDYFNNIKSSGESYFISINYGGFKKKIEIKGEINNNKFSFKYCILQPFSLKSQYILSRDITGVENYVKISYCKLVR